MSQPPQDIGNVNANANANANASSNSETVNLTLNHINKLLIGVNLAQSRGAYTFEDSAELAETVKLVSKFIKINSESQAKEQEQKKTPQ